MTTVVIALLASFAFAAPPPSAAGDNFIPCNALLGNPKHYRAGAIMLGKTPLTDATKLLGKVRFQQSGEGATYQRSACYSVGGKSFFIVQATDVDDPDIAALRLTAFPDRDEACREVAPLKVAAKTDSGLMVGMSKAALVKLLGRPNAENDNRLEWQCSQPLNSANVTITLSVNARLQNDKAVDIEIGSVTTDN